MATTLKRRIIEEPIDKPTIVKRRSVGKKLDLTSIAKSIAEPIVSTAYPKLGMFKSLVDVERGIGKVQEKIESQKGIPEKFKGEHPYAVGIGTQAVSDVMELFKPTTIGTAVLGHQFIYKPLIKKLLSSPRVAPIFKKTISEAIDNLPVVQKLKLKKMPIEEQVNYLRDRGMLAKAIGKDPKLKAEAKKQWLKLPKETSITKPIVDKSIPLSKKQIAIPRRTITSLPIEQAQNQPIEPLIKPPTEITKLAGNEEMPAAISYETQKDIWFGRKDLRIHDSKVEQRLLQKELKANLGKEKYDIVAQKYDKAIKIYIDTKRDPGHINEYFNQLNQEQQAIVTQSQNLPENVKAIADKIAKSHEDIGLEALEADIIRNVLDNFTNRIWDIKGKSSVETFRKFGTTTRHAKQRKLKTIIEGWAKGYTLKVEGATTNLQILKEEIIKTIEDKKFIKSLQGIKTLEGNPLLSTQQLEGYKKVNHPNFKTWKQVGKAVEGKSYGKNSFIDDKGNLFERQSLYAPEKQAKNMNNILGVSALKGIKGFDFATKHNAIVKAWVLQSSLFHHMAFMRSYYFGTNNKTWDEMNLRQAYKQGLKAIESSDPVIRLLVKKGLTLGLKQDWSEELLQEKTAIGRVLDRMKVTRVVKDKILDLRQAQANWLFGEFGAGLKAKSGLIEFRNQLKKYPNENQEVIAERVARLINNDFGGLHLQRLGRNPTVQHAFRLFSLAPDWTESNIRTIAKAFSSDKAEAEMYRKFWAGIFTKGALLTVFANLLINKEEFVENYKKAWKAGDFKWLDVDITNIYKAVGGKSGNRKYFSIFGHFKDPLKFITHPIRSAHHKGSIIYKLFYEAFEGTDWAGRRFTTAKELIGQDTEKGYYKTSRKGKFKKGDPKFGKLKGKTVTWDYSKKGPIEYSQFPSFILSKIKDMQPIQIQNLLGWLAGETEGFDAISKSLGLNTKTEYVKDKEPVKKVKKEEVVVIKKRNL